MMMRHERMQPTRLPVLPRLLKYKHSHYVHEFDILSFHGQNNARRVQDMYWLSESIYLVPSTSKGHQKTIPQRS